MITIKYREPTPNPKAYKFVTDTRLVGEGALSFTTAEEAEAQPLAKKVFGLTGVDSVYFMGDFVSVTADEGSDWDAIEQAVRDNIDTFEPVETAGPPKAKPDPNNEMLNKINEVIDEYIRPALANDGGGLEVLGLEDKVVTVQYQGACGGCPSAASGTLNAIENLLRTEVDEEIQIVSV